MTNNICAADLVHPIDLAFLIDGSINAGEDNFKKELTFVRKLCNRLVLLRFSACLLTNKIKKLRYTSVLICFLCQLLFRIQVSNHKARCSRCSERYFR